MTDLAIPLAFGVVSSLHCAQMCGPIVLAYSMGGRGTPLGHLGYNAGRIATYSLLGAAAGAAGHAMGFVGKLAGIQQTAFIVSGVLMVIAGLVMSGFAPNQSLIQIKGASLVSRAIGQLMMSRGVSRKIALGLIMGFLPCGLLYAALLKAASTGSATAGAASMAAFGLGTAGTLLALGIFSSTIAARMGRWSNALASFSVMAMGVVLVWRGLIAQAPRMACHVGV